MNEMMDRQADRWIDTCLFKYLSAYLFIYLSACFYASIYLDLGEPVCTIFKSLKSKFCLSASLPMSIFLIPVVVTHLIILSSVVKCSRSSLVDQVV